MNAEQSYLKLLETLSQRNWLVLQWAALGLQSA